MVNLIKFCLKPHVLILLTVIISLFAWWLPINSRKGFNVAENLEPGSVILIISWYLIIIFIAYVGFHFGRRVRPIQKLNYNNSVISRYAYRILTILGLIGVFFTYFTIFRNNPNFVNDILQANANQLKYALYENYSQGVHSLRYLTILSGTLATINIMKQKKSLLDFINLLAVISTALVSSRLAIIMLVVLLTCSLIYEGLKIRKTYIMAISVLLFIALTIFNYSRNANFYNAVYGIENPVMMNLAEIITYLGAPFQATLGVFNNIWEFDRVPGFIELVSFLIPETFHSLIGIETSFVSTYRSFVDIEDSLTTNSAAVQLIDSLGFYSIFIMGITILFYSILIGHFSKYNNILAFISYVFLYCSFEVWRLFLFNQGIIHTLVLGILLSYIGGVIFYELIKRKKPV